jgi:D-alanyl-D-alanine carboxypeptidase
MTFEFPIRAGATLLVGVALLIAACPRPGSTAGSSALKPIDQAALQTMVDTTAKELLIPGAVVLLRTPQGEFTVTYGTTLLGAISPPRANTHFRIASNTKTMTAAVIVLLTQEGKLSLDDPVSKYVPGVPNGDKITIAELLKMRSGLYSYDDDPEFWAILDRDPTKVWSPAELLAIAFKHPPYFPPGTGFHYSNANYALLGLIAEKLDQKPLASCFQDRLFGPLGLKDTLLPATTSNALPDPYSHGYLYGSCSFSNLVDKPYPPDLQAAAKAGTLKPDDCTGQNPSYASAAGGVISTPTISPPGSRHWSAAKCSTPTISASGSTACSPRCQASPRAKSTGTASAKLAGDRTRFIFTAARCPASTRKSATTQPTS